MAEGPLKTALYIRLSREDGDREESDSVGNQKKLLLDYLSGRPDMELQGIYTDDGYTGTSFDRPAFKRMLDEIRAGRIGCVLVKDLSRFGRDYIDAGRYLEREFPARGVRFVSVADGIDSAREAYDLLLPIKNIFNEQYARDISVKIRTALRAKQRAGEFIGAFACYGYEKSPLDKNRLEPDVYAAGVVRRIYSMYLNGMSKRAIAGALNREGILCPGEYKRAKGARYQNPHGGRLWTYPTVHGILHNKIYTGTMVQGKKRQELRRGQRVEPKDHWIEVPKTHEAIISEELWERVQQLSAGRRQAETPRRPAEPHPLSGLIFCGDCGKAMVKSSWKRADGSLVQVFYCGTYKRQGKNYCSSHAVSCEMVFGEILRELKSLFEETKEWREQLFKDEKDGGQLLKRRERTERALLRARARKRACYEDYRDGLIGRDEFKAYHEDYRRQEELLSESLEALRAEGEALFSDSSPALRLNRLSAAILVEQVLVYGDGRILVRYRNEKSC